MKNSTDFLDIENDSISFLDLVKKIKKLFFFLLKKWKALVLLLILSIAMGFTFKFFKKTQYTAKISFILEDGKGGGAISGLAGQVGIDLSSLSGGNSGFFSGDNILLFLKSNELSRKTLLTQCDSISPQTLADKYMETYNLNTSWKKKFKKEINFFNYKEIDEDRLKDSLLQLIINRITLKQLVVDRIEKKSTFIGVEVKTLSDIFSKLYCERLVQNTTNTYIQIKTRRQKSNVDRLQKRADSIGSILNYKTFSSAAEQEKILDVNPGSRTVTVNAEVSNRDKIMLTTLYAEVIKNLELAKISLNQEIPIIQVIDTPRYPLKDDSKKYIIVTLFLVAFSFIGWIGFFITKFILK
jgi:hypothetical protein